MKAIIISIMVISTLGLIIGSGCSSSKSTNPTTGELRLVLVDNPAQYDQVNIVVTKVEVHQSGSDSLSGWTTMRSDTATYDLLNLRNGASAILGDAILAPGMYTQIRLSIGSGSNVVIGNVTHPLDVSSATGLKLNNSFTIEAGNLYELILDFDAEKSIVVTGNNQYKLQPVIRVEPLIISGSISGTLVPVSARSTIWTTTGIDTVSTVCDSITGFFKLMALPAGSYNLTIMPADTAYADTTMGAINVTAQQDTNIGTVTLRQR